MSKTRRYFLILITAALFVAAAFLVAGKSKSLIEGWQAAADLIDSGKALAKLKELASA